MKFSKTEVSEQKQRLIACAQEKLDKACRLTGAEFENYVETIRDQYVMLWYIAALSGETNKTGAYQYSAEKAIKTLKDFYDIQGIKLENDIMRNGGDRTMNIRFELPEPIGSCNGSCDKNKN